MIPFPTRPSPRPGQRPGYPMEADPCRCHHRVLSDGTCIFCGHWPLCTIRATWARRAAQLLATSAERVPA